MFKDVYHKLTRSSFQKAIVPRLKSWIHKVVFEEEEGSAKKTDSKPSLEQEVAAAAAAVSDVARASQEMLLSKSEGEFVNFSPHLVGGE